MKRIAYASPLNPVPSGISDYSEELLPYLAQYGEITPYVADDLRPNHSELLRCMDVRLLSQLARDHRRRPYDAIIYHIGNNPAHEPIWQAMQRVPGVVVLHEFVLHHFMLHSTLVVRQDVQGYRDEMTRRYGPEGEQVANLVLGGSLPDAIFDMPLCESVLAAAKGIIGHSDYVLNKAQTVRPELPSGRVRMGVPLPPLIPRDTARAQLHLTSDAQILASYGHLAPHKRIEGVLRAIHDLRNTYGNLHYLLVGSVSPNYDVRATVSRLGLDDVVTITGYVDRSDFEAYIAATDICLNLRHPTAGETSASLLRLLGAGRPTLVTGKGAFAELPSDVALQVPPDESEHAVIISSCRLLIEQPDKAADLGAKARDYVAREHTLDGAATDYMRFLSTLHGWEAPKKLREGPLWVPGTETREPSHLPNRRPEAGLWQRFRSSRYNLFKRTRH